MKPSSHKLLFAYTQLCTYWASYKIKSHVSTGLIDGKLFVPVCDIQANFIKNFESKNFTLHIFRTRLLQKFTIAHFLEWITAQISNCTFFVVFSDIDFYLILSMFTDHDLFFEKISECGQKWLQYSRRYTSIATLMLIYDSRPQFWL